LFDRFSALHTRDRGHRPRGDRLLLHDQHVRQVAEAESTPRPAVAAGGQHGEDGDFDRTPVAHHRRDLQTVCRREILRLLSDEDAGPDDPRSGVDQQYTDQGLLALRGPRFPQGPGLEHTRQRVVLLGGSQVEGDETETEPGIHVRQVEDDPRPNRRVQ